MVDGCIASIYLDKLYTDAHTHTQCHIQLFYVRLKGLSSIRSKGPALVTGQVECCSSRGQWPSDAVRVDPQRRCNRTQD